MRKKQAYAMVQEGGKSKVEKKGMEDEIRDGYDYEMTIAFEIINDNHMAKSTKDRTGLFDGQPEFVITPEVGQRIKQWCESGAEPVAPEPPSDDFKSKVEACNTQKELVTFYNEHKADVDVNPLLQQLISNRRSSINSKQLNNA
jgi:hypothetical protein